MEGARIERLSVLKDGSVAYRGKYPTRGKTHRVMQPLELMARLAAIVAPPRFPLWRYHGVLAPGAPWRKLIVPSSEPEQRGCSHKVGANSSGPPREGAHRRKPSGDPSLLRTATQPTAPCGEPAWRPNTSYVPWPELLRHCFEQDVLDCPRCHSRLQPLAVIRSQAVIDRILQHLSMPPVPVQLTHPDTVAVDVTDEPLPDWSVGVDPQAPDPVEQAPPSDWDGVDPPAPDDGRNERDGGMRHRACARRRVARRRSVRSDRGRTATTLGKGRWMGHDRWRAGS